MPEPPDETFRDLGLLGPLELITRDECREIMAHEARTDLPKPVDWWKGRAVSDPFYHSLACDERILSRLRPVLGDDIVLWGVDFLQRKPQEVHPWHCDIESCAVEGGFASVWIGLDNISRESALICISRSHLLGRTIQEEAAQRGLKRGQASAEAVLAWARAHDARAEVIQPDMRDGDAIIFDGRIWHGTYNSRNEGVRSALLVQYAAADRPVRMIDLDYLEWPFRFREDLRPPVIAVSGSADDTVNRIVPPPVGSDVGAVVDSTGISFKLPLEKDPGLPWKPFPQFRGPTRSLSLMGCHVSALDPGHSPHPPHAHDEEEILIILDGEAEITIANEPNDPSPRVETLAVGQFSYYPAYQHHTIRNSSDRAVSYLMFKWRSGKGRHSTNELPAAVYDFRPQLSAPDNRSFAPKLIFDSPTLYLKNLHCHLTHLKPGAGYEAHVDSYDVALVLFSGLIDTGDYVVRGPGVVYFGSGIPHGMKNIAPESATYLVIEFHAA